MSAIDDLIEILNNLREKPDFLNSNLISRLEKNKDKYAEEKVTRFAVCKKVINASPINENRAFLLETENHRLIVYSHDTYCVPKDEDVDFEWKVLTKYFYEDTRVKDYYDKKNFDYYLEKDNTESTHSTQNKLRIALEKFLNMSKEIFDSICQKIKEFLTPKRFQILSEEFLTMLKNIFGSGGSGGTHGPVKPHMM
ncbi:2391_t:CDS:2 [Acaulospora morrowiae]|uniref:2391_t:CDS:1 n=1 Tax=Acaulospora morrowiae TaxID=94023 RepID=A0A9N8V661_9GLOM|nr:2391_t:CDS:2 [Acaulospora morrowiae]